MTVCAEGLPEIWAWVLCRALKKSCGGWLTDTLPLQRILSSSPPKEWKALWFCKDSPICMTDRQKTAKGSAGRE